jgi:myo-inositol-1(or 4)-monophosphatase
VAPSAVRRWCVDPLDGTLNYSRTLPIWGVSIALFDGARPVLGVVHDPTRGETFAAANGYGAYCNGAPLETSAVDSLEDAFVHLTVDFHDGSMQEGLDDLVRVAPRVLRTRNIGSAALALAYVAAGRLDAVLHRFAHPWDYGAGVVLVAEAGGTITNMEGDAYTIEDRTMLAASRGSLHAGLLALLSTVASPRLQ